MRFVSRTSGDVLLAVFAVLVVVGAVAAVKQGGNAPVVAEPSVTVGATSTPTPIADPTATATEIATGTPSPGASRRARTVVLAGSDLAKLTSALASVTGYAVRTVGGAGPEILAPGALDAVTSTPTAVVLEVQAGSQTTARTSTAITTVRKKWPLAQVFVVGPFSSGDRKSAAAAKAASLAGKATFLDPVLLKWRTVDNSPTLSAADLKGVTAKLAAALA